MLRIEHNMVIDRPVKEFLAFLCNPVNDPYWNLNIIETWITSPGPIEVETTGSNIGRFLGQRNETTFVYNLYEPPMSVFRSHHIGIYGCDDG